MLSATVIGLPFHLAFHFVDFLYTALGFLAADNAKPLKAKGIQLVVRDLHSLIQRVLAPRMTRIN